MSTTFWLILLTLFTLFDFIDSIHFIDFAYCIDLIQFY